MHACYFTYTQAMLSLGLGSGGGGAADAASGVAHGGGIWQTFNHATGEFQDDPSGEFLCEVLAAQFIENWKDLVRACR